MQWGKNKNLWTFISNVHFEVLWSNQSAFDAQGYKINMCNTAWEEQKSVKWKCRHSHAWIGKKISCSEKDKMTGSEQIFSLQQQNLIHLVLKNHKTNLAFHVFPCFYSPKAFYEVDFSCFVGKMGFYMIKGSTNSETMLLRLPYVTVSHLSTWQGLRQTVLNIPFED